MRKYRKLVVKLSQAEEQELAKLLRAGTQPVRVIKRAQSLRLLAAGQTPPRVGQSVGLTARGVRHIGWRYVERGLSAALYDPAWPGAPRRIEAAQKQRIIAMVCTEPPEGQARWTVRLIAEEAVKRKLVPKIGRESVRLLLENHELKPWREKNVVRRRTRRGIRREDGGRAGGL
jgi:hypothetical protein